MLYNLYMQFLFKKRNGKQRTHHWNEHLVLENFKCISSESWFYPLKKQNGQMICLNSKTCYKLAKLLQILKFLYTKDFQIHADFKGIKYWNAERGGSKKKECFVFSDSLVLPVICRRKQVKEWKSVKANIKNANKFVKVSEKWHNTITIQHAN